MKKTILGIIIVLGAVVLAGCGTKTAVQNGAVVQDQTQGAQSGSSSAQEQKKGLFSFLTEGVGVRCTVEDKSGTLTIISNGKKVRIDGMNVPSQVTRPEQKPEDESGSMINDGTWVYLWGGKSGMKFNIKDMEALKDPSQGQQEDQNSKMSDWQDWMKSLEASGTKYDCNPTTISDSDFVPPAEIQFQDMGEFIKQMKNIGSQYQNMKVPGQMPGQVPN